MSYRKPIRAKEVQNPERILSNLLQDYVTGALDDYTFLYRASVVAIDQVGGQLETNPPNPKNSIRARVITNGRDKDTDDADLTVFWPLFPFDVMPLKEGEHVYIVFEDAAIKRHGLWLTRIPEPATTDNPNLTLGTRKYEDNSSNNMSEVGADKIVQDTDISPAPINQSPEFVTQVVPKFRPRIGDRVIEGSHNTVIILGRDRTSSINSGQVNDAGSIDMIAGRSTEDDLNPANDRSRLIISMNSNPDADFDINVGTNSGPKASIIAKSDEIRIIARSGMKLIVEGGNLHVEANNILLGKNATESVIKGNVFNTIWKKVLNLITTHGHPLPPNSPSPALATLPIDGDLEIGLALSKKSKTE